MSLEIFVTRSEARQINFFRKKFIDNEGAKNKAIYAEVFQIRNGEVLRKLGKPDWISIDNGGWHKKVVDLDTF